MADLLRPVIGSRGDGQMKLKTVTALSTAIASLFLAQTFALAESESGGLENASYSSMTGSISNAGGGNQSGGVLTTGSVSETGGPRETQTNSQSGGALVSRGENQSRGISPASESGVSPLWLPVGWGNPSVTNAPAAPSTTSAASQETSKSADQQPERIARIPNMTVRNYHWQNRKTIRTSNTKFAYRSRTAM